MSVPKVAISVRQPWAWLIVNQHKDIENRTWPTRFRGEFLVHASKGMTRAEYDEARDFAFWAYGGCELPIPTFEALERGGIVGSAEIIDCVSHSESRWFVGNHGFVLRNARPLPFVPLKGMLGFFKVVDSHV